VEKQQRGHYFIFTFRRPQGITRLLWARTSAAVTLRVPALAKEGLLVSAVGDTVAISARDGFYTLTLEGARCRGECLVGGPPLFLVENGMGDVGPIATAEPATRAAETPTPIPTATHTLTPSPTFTPSPTLTPSPTATPSSTPTATATARPSATATTEVVAAVLPTLPSAAVEETAALPSVQTAWLFIGAGLFLGLLLILYIRRHQRTA